MDTARETWVDAAKGLAIFLVVVFHGCQGLVRAGLWPVGGIWAGSNEAVYCFHVQLLFLCSGYLWQRYGWRGGRRGHGRAALGKVWRLGVPYVAFAAAFWALKVVCGPSVNHLAGPLWRDLVLAPAAPFWYLPALVLLFALLPVAKGKRAWTWLFAATVLAKAATVAWNHSAWCFPVRVVAKYAFWFSSGMGLALWGTEPLRGRTGGWVGAACGLLFLGDAVAAGAVRLWWPHQWWGCKATQWGLGLLACAAVLAWAVRRTAPGTWEWLGRHSLPVFLMHTTFAAAVRMGLSALGVRALWLHVPAMLAASFAGPLAAMRVLEWVRLDGLVDPRLWQLQRKTPPAGRIGLPNGAERG